MLIKNVKIRKLLKKQWGFIKKMFAKSKDDNQFSFIIIIFKKRKYLKSRKEERKRK